MSGITVAICTRDRPASLARALASIAVAGRGMRSALVVQLIDDGDLPATWLTSQRAVLAAEGIPLRHHRKSEPGLWRSRQAAVELAEEGLILFLDDDVEIDPHYLHRLAALARRRPWAAGFGGVDVLTGRAPWHIRLAQFAVLQRAVHPGRLAAGGHGRSQDTWTEQRAPFRSEYLSGCNMAFHRRAICDLVNRPWLHDYCLGEDMLLSRLARQHGELIVDPALRVRHHHDPAGRDRAAQLGHDWVLNHRRLLEDRHAGRVPRVAQALAVAGEALLLARHRPGSSDRLSGVLAAAIRLTGRSMRGLTHATAPGCEPLLTVIVSQDRAAQLDLLLRSLYLGAPDAVATRTVVRWRASDAFFRSGYLQAMRHHPGVEWQEEHPPLGISDGGLARTLARHRGLVAFFRDVDVLSDRFSLDDPAVQEFRSDPSIACLSLRLGRDRRPRQGDQQAPVAFGSARLGWIWRWRELIPDRSYVRTLDGHVFRAGQIWPHLADATGNRSQPAAAWSRKRPFVLSYDRPRVVDSEVDHLNGPDPSAAGHAVHERNRRFLAGDRIALGPFLASEHTTPHVSACGIVGDGSG